MAKMFIVKRFPKRKAGFNNHHVSKFNVFNGEETKEKLVEVAPIEEEIPIEEEVQVEEPQVEEIPTEEPQADEDIFVEDEKLEKKVKKDNKKRKKKDMITENQIASAEEKVENLFDNPVKVVKKDRGLIERAESSKIILTEDNRQVLND